jgi:LmbE family N-acetylglucosaminyl deacetylase
VKRTPLWQLGVMLLVLGCCGARNGAADITSLVAFSESDRILVLAPHPDDESIACGGVIQRALAQGLPVRVVFLTYGDNNEESFAVYRKHPVVNPRAVRAMGEIRHGEALAAARTLGLKESDVTFLGYPDFRTLHIWYDHWGDTPPQESMLTRVRAVPYADAFRPGAPYKGEEILADLKSVLRDFRPTHVFVSHPADYNPDHRALYLFTRAALWDLAQEISPRVHPYLVHYPGWPRPRGYRPHSMQTPPQLREELLWEQLVLNEDEVATKFAAVRSHRTQFGYASSYLSSFVRRNELFSEFSPIPLKPRSQEIESVSGGGFDPRPPLELLNAEEKARFVGIESWQVGTDGEKLLCSVGFRRPLAAAVAVSVDIFGYRAGRDFAEMPKLRVHVNALGCSVLERGKPVPMEGVHVEKGARSVTVQLPFSAIRDPDRILISARTYMGEVPLDWIPWRVLLRNAP